MRISRAGNFRKSSLNTSAFHQYIFMDDHNSGDWQADFALTQDIGRAFLPAFVPLVEKRREGNAIFYRRALPAVDDSLHQALLEQVDATVLRDEVAERLATVQGRRAEQSRDFFARHARDLAEQQELTLPEDHAKTRGPSYYH